MDKLVSGGVPSPVFDVGATIPYGINRVSPRVEGCLIIADGKVVASWIGWVFTDPQDYRDYLEREGIEWRSFTVISFVSEPGVIRHRAVCGSVKPA